MTPAERLAEYRRDALFSLASFAGMEILKRTSPQLFLSMKVARSLLVLAIARKFIQNGVQGMVKDHRPNADTLTATAVIASVLAGKPESSLTLLAISNGAEMLTSYAAERARTQISGLLSLDQRYVWLVDGEVERKVPIEQVKAGVEQPVTYADVWEFWLQYPEVAPAVDFLTIHLLPYWEDDPTGIDGRAVLRTAARTCRQVAGHGPMACNPGLHGA